MTKKGGGKGEKRVGTTHTYGQSSNLSFEFTNFSVWVKLSVR